MSVHSTADEGSVTVRAADRRVKIGPADPKWSYLYPPAIIEAALACGAQAIHPGYGFLSEDPDFAEMCRENDLVFVGPDPEVMAQLGDKAIARRLMAKAGLPMAPGTIDSASSTEEVTRAAKEIGFPLIIKVAAGGGGRGMVVVEEISDLLPAFRAREHWRSTRRLPARSSGSTPTRYPGRGCSRTTIRCWPR